MKIQLIIFNSIVTIFKLKALPKTKSLLGASFLSFLLALMATPITNASTLGLNGGLSFNFTLLDEMSQPSLKGADGISLGLVTVRNSKADPQMILIRRRLAVRIDGAGGTATSARVSVALSSLTSGCSVRLNGIELSSIPQLVEPLHKLGSSVAHQIELRVPPGVPAGPLLSSIKWIANTN